MFSFMDRDRSKLAKRGLSPQHITRLERTIDGIRRDLNADAKLAQRARPVFTDEEFHIIEKPLQQLIEAVAGFENRWQLERQFESGVQWEFRELADAGLDLPTMEGVLRRLLKDLRDTQPRRRPVGNPRDYSAERWFDLLAMLDIMECKRGTARTVLFWALEDGTKDEADRKDPWNRADTILRQYDAAKRSPEWRARLQRASE